MDSGTLDIHRLIVDPNVHRRGVATALLRRLLRTESAAERAIVQTGAENGPAVAFYRREGFAWTGDVELSGVRVSRFVKRLR
jgi:ribosomal protein S18 acetylase RimI-like enzyme